MDITKPPKFAIFARALTRYGGFTRSAGLWAFCRIESPIRVRQTPSAFHRVHNEPLSVVAVRVRNPDCSPFGINR
jgi:hypothetical protein